ncbi:hypothetical protein PILCRDRAFT_507981 [Piloderma croceum F 1598]|uniref:Ubiquitin-like domain-containing protein n=1 Tax=Piloderma croceum (strain F 1598) TaxID=765440 RepID=A0A0C3B508_PILCF|nr:hypothetical protein PILCRDRAFT_507981 [Piloderma croceum F 1598]
MALGHVLVALNSIFWEDLGNKLRAASLRNIQVTKILVLDHLGQYIPVPTMFCSTWEGFNYIIHGYCKDRPGYRFVERGEYQMIRAADNQTIDPSEFASTIAPEMKFEMSIILRKMTAFQKNRGKCPQCHFVNSHVPAAHGWIEWKVLISFPRLLIINAIYYSRGCERQFQITEATPTQQNDKNDGMSNAWDDAASDSESSEEVFNGNDHAGDVEDIISPGVYVSFFCGVAISDVA